MLLSTKVVAPIEANGVRAPHYFHFGRDFHLLFSSSSFFEVQTGYMRLLPDMAASISHFTKSVLFGNLWLAFAGCDISPIIASLGLGLDAREPHLPSQSRHESSLYSVSRCTIPSFTHYRPFILPELILTKEHGKFLIDQAIVARLSYRKQCIKLLQVLCILNLHCISFILEAFRWRFSNL